MSAESYPQEPYPVDPPTQPYWQAPPSRRRSPWSTVGAAAALVAVIVVTAAATKFISGPNNMSTTTPTSLSPITPSQQAAPRVAPSPPPPPPAATVICSPCIGGFGGPPGTNDYGPPVPPPPDPEAQAAARLAALANEDGPFVGDVLSGHWVAQLSSKQVSTIDDGIQYDDVSILNEHLGLRADDNAKLLTKGGYWVTVAPLVFTDQASANNWCRAVGRDTDHCFATRLNTGAAN